MRKANTPAILPCIARGKVLPAFLFSLLVLSGTAKGQCISTGNHPGTQFTTEKNPNNGLAFSSLANASHADISYASAQPLVALEGEERTQYLKATGFNFSVPSNAIICGVTVLIRKRASGVSSATTISDEDIKLVKDGNLTGLNKRSETSWAPEFVTESYSGDAAYWGTTLTPADVNDPRFGVALSARLFSTVAAFPRVEIDQVSIVVQYQTPSTTLPNVESLAVSLQKNIVSCEWTMTEEEAGSHIILQHSTDNRQWKDLAAYSVTANARQTKYRQVNRLEEKGTYYYRVKIISKESATSYSKTTRIQYNSSGELKVYPTVARSMIYVENAEPTDKIQVYNFSNQQMPISTVQVKDGLTAVRISDLPKGRYLLKAGRTTRQFIKD
ncbi:MAG TPA: T9SS type A sorting domain-containing protein [Chitinophagaceae bacterium]